MTNTTQRLTPEQRVRKYISWTISGRWYISGTDAIDCIADAERDTEARVLAALAVPLSTEEDRLRQEMLKACEAAVRERTDPKLMCWGSGVTVDEILVRAAWKTIRTYDAAVAARTGGGGWHEVIVALNHRHYGDDWFRTVDDIVNQLKVAGFAPPERKAT